MRINTNVAAIGANRNLQATNAAVSSSMQKLSSGFRINRAADDAAGLGIANKFRSDIRALNQAASNGEQANSLLQIAEGATSNVQKMLERMKELATQSASDSVDDDGRDRIQAEFDALRTEITRTVDTTKFQGKKLLDGEFGNTIDRSNAANTAFGATGFVQDVKISGAKQGTYTLSQTAAGEVTLTDADGNTEVASVGGDGKQTLSFAKFGLTVTTQADYVDGAAGVDGDIVVEAGANGSGTFRVSATGSGSDDDITLETMDLTSGDMDLSALDLSSLSGAQTAMTALDDAMGSIAETLGNIGAAQNRIEYAVANTKTTIQNYSAAESVIRDVDMAEEMTKFSKNQILSQAGTAMLAQANQSAQGVLSLLRG